MIDENYRVPQPEQAMAIDKELTPTLAAAKIGLKNYRQLGRKGDLVVFLSQIQTDIQRKDEPALVLANARAPRERHVYIPLSMLWRLVLPASGDKPTRWWAAQLRQAVEAFTQHLYGLVTSQDCYRVQDAIYEFAEDLQKAPCPSWMSTPAWLEALRQDGFTFRKNGREIDA